MDPSSESKTAKHFVLVAAEWQAYQTFQSLGERVATSVVCNNAYGM